MKRRWGSVACVLALVVGILYVHVTGEDPVVSVRVSGGKYDIVALQAPTVRGIAVRALPLLLELPVIGTILVHAIKRQNGFHLLRSFVAQTRADPMTYPVLPASDELRVHHDNLALQGTVADFLRHQPPSPKSKAAHQQFAYASIDDYHQAYLKGTTTPLEVAQRLINFLETRDKATINAVSHLNSSDVLLQAKASTERYKAGSPIGILDGVPVPVKNCVMVKGYVLTSGTKFLEHVNPRATEDSELVARIRAAGGIIVAGVAMHELGAGATGLSLHFGATRNPHDLDRATGASSSGSAALVAAGLAPIAIGTDGGGSIRTPSSLCGTYGIKPTHERVPDTGKVLSTVTVAGVLASSPRDLAIGYAIIAGPSPKSAISNYQPQPHLADFSKTSNLRGIRIGFFREYFEHAEPEIVAACYKRLDHLKSLGAEVVDIAIPHMRMGMLAHSTSILLDSSGFMDRFWDKHKSDLQPDIRVVINLARSLSAREWLAAQQVRRILFNELKAIFATIDVIVSPTTAITAPLYHPDAFAYGENDVETLSYLIRFAFLGNLLGLPSVTTPAGFDHNNLPIGFQIMADHFNEHLLLRMANVFTGLENFHQPNGVYYSPLG
eukprot:m.628319 g.628319  ORF g.628319 m.628319 type:complete len:610 (+) comp58259_c0_seq3:123-1952(+)